MYKGKIRALIIKPMERPKVCYVEPTIKAFKRVVGAKDIQAKGLEQGVYIVTHKDTFSSNLTPNRQVGNKVIKGTMLVVQTNKKRLPISLTDDNISKYSLRFWSLETFEEI